MTVSRHRRYERSPLVYEAHDFMKVRSESGVLPVSCWCERRIVAVSQIDVQTGKTASCGHPRCHSPGPNSMITRAPRFRATSSAATQPER